MNKRFFSLILTTAVFAAVFSSCDKDDVTYTVTFDSKGGSAVTAQTVKQGDKVQKPADPTRENYSLAGWAKADNETSALWNFETETVTANMTLFARWSINMYSVTFDSNGGSAVTAQNVAHGGTATKPADPTRSGYEFDGWFNGETEWNFSTAITAAITLKAKWTAVHIVTFDSDGGSTVPTQTIRNCNTATKPATDPTKNGFEFDGWFVGETEWNFATAITAPITLKAKWTAVHIVTFDSDGGNVVPAQTIRNGNMATKPEDPTKTIASGLYLGTPNGSYTFDGWYYGETKWDFNAAIIAPITLNAKWTLPDNVIRIASVLSNDVAAAVTYVNANSISGEEYTLLIGTNVTSGTQTLNAPNAKLTIIGIGAERTITSTSSNFLFTIDGNNATSLTFEQNIILKNGNIRSDYLVYVRRGSLTMRNGSKITGNDVLAVSIVGINAIFKMEGGEISGNNPYTSNPNWKFGCVNVSAGGTFEMSGGNITDNTAYSSLDDVYIDYDCIFRLSGSARIGKITLSANNNTTRSTVTIAGNFSGTVTTLHLCGSINSLNTIADWWTNVPVIVGGTTSSISMFNNGLGNFRNNMSAVTPISVTHVLNNLGLLVLKEN